MRRLRSFWDVHRFRIAPQVAAVLHRLEGEGRLESEAASLVSFERRGEARRGEALAVGFRPRVGCTVDRRSFDLVVDTTGPAHRAVVERAPIASP